MVRQLSPSEWDEWARSPATQEFQRQLQETIEDAGSAWSYGHYNGATAEETLRLNTVAIAGVDMLRQVCTRINDRKLLEEGKENE